jgi:hypothetical protein
MPIKFEGQFKYRNESKVNAGLAPAAVKSQKWPSGADCGRPQDSVYPAVSPNDNHRRSMPGVAAAFADRPHAESSLRRTNTAGP